MIYSKVENPKCRICTFAKDKPSGGNVTCIIKGIVPEDFCCKKFKYDIFKKTIKPKKAIHKNKFSAEDFAI